MSDLTDAQFAVYIDRILECRKAEDTAKEDTRTVYTALADAGGDKTEAGLLVRALRMEEKDAGKAKAREELLEEARLRYRRGKASHVRAREGSQSYAEAKGVEPRGFIASLSDEQKAAALAYRGDETHGGELTDTQEQPETTSEIPTGSHDQHHELVEGPEGQLEKEPLATSDAVASVSAPHSPSPVAAQAQTGEADDVHPQASSATISEADIPAFLRNDEQKPEEKSDCLKLKDGHCRISFPTSALCAECNAERMKARVA